MVVLTDPFWILDIDKSRKVADNFLSSISHVNTSNDLVCQGYWKRNYVLNQILEPLFE